MVKGHAVLASFVLTCGERVNLMAALPDFATEWLS